MKSVKLLGLAKFLVIAKSTAILSALFALVHYAPWLNRHIADFWGHLAVGALMGLAALFLLGVANFEFHEPEHHSLFDHHPDQTR